MFIPQEKLDELDEATTEGLFDEHAEVEEEKVEAEVVEKVEEKVSESTDEDSVADKARVPYSRFETVNERAIRAEERLKILEEQLQSSGKTESTGEIEIPEEWVELYGDSDAAKRAYQLQVKSLERIQEQTTERILKEIQTKQIQEKEAAEENLKAIEENINKFEETLGRKLSEAEEAAILDIQDEWTPKDAEGNYLTALIPAEKAYEIYTLRQSSANKDKIIARKKVVAVTGSGTESESSNSAFDNYRPGVGGLWRDKLN